MPQLHMPLQSGSDRILKAMRRSYRSERFLGILDRVRARIPHAAITTDIIVGFPGETEEDFEDTLRVVEQSRFASAFTFQYSIRPGTPAATMPDQVPKAVVQERYERLTALQDRISRRGEPDARRPRGRGARRARARAARTTRRTGCPAAPRTTGSCTSTCPTGSDVPRPGDVVTVAITRRRAVPPRSPTRRRRAAARAAHARRATPGTAREAASCACPRAGERAGGAAGRRCSLGPARRCAAPLDATRV